MLMLPLFYNSLDWLVSDLRKKKYIFASQLKTSLLKLRCPGVSTEKQI